MKWLTILAICMASQAIAKKSDESFDCTLGTAYSVKVNEEGVGNANPIRFGGDRNQEPWRFRLVKKERTIAIVWPNSPMQFHGESSTIQTGKASFASFIVGKGPCLFTDGHCGTLIHFSMQPDETLKIQLQPIALGSLRDAREEPFLATIEGTCSAKEAGK